MRRVSTLLKPTARTTPDEWARKNRVYPATAGIPGPRKPELTPYGIPVANAIAARTHRRVVAVFGAQMGKTDSILDAIGQRLDTSPVPMLYVGPTQQMIKEQFEPRIMALLDEAPTLRSKVARGKRMTKTRKIIAGVPLRLAHGGSSAAMKSDPFGLAFTDEADEMVANLNGQGSPIELIDMRGNTYADFVHAIVSTPSKGPSEVVVDPDSGLEFWADTDPQEVESTIWKLWLSGTRHHWSWPCPHCGEYFIPRFRCLGWDKPQSPAGRDLPSTPALAKRTAHMVCPRNGCIIRDDEPVTGTNMVAQEWMNSRGTYVAPGQWVEPDGAVKGPPPDSWTVSFWASGLASPFKTWGEHAAAYVAAVRSGDHAVIQTTLNGGFGELYTPGDGDVPEWAEVAKLRDAAEELYRIGEIPDGVRILTMTVDVQKSRLVYIIRGWGAEATSWLIDAGELFGETEQPQVWNDLASMMQTPIDGMPIKLVMIDSGFRPGKKDTVPEHRVYEFCRRFPHLTRATKGSSLTMRKPIVSTKIDVKINGKEFKKGLNLLRLDVDYFKSLVHQKIRWPEDAPGFAYLPTDLSDDYCMQIVSEARIKTPSGGSKWVQRSKENHFLDCEAMQFAAAMLLNVRAIGGDVRKKLARKRAASPVEEELPAVAEERGRDEKPAAKRKTPQDRKPYMQRTRYW